MSATQRLGSLHRRSWDCHDCRLVSLVVTVALGSIALVTLGVMVKRGFPMDLKWKALVSCGVLLPLMAICLYTWTMECRQCKVKSPPTIAIEEWQQRAEYSDAAKKPGRVYGTGGIEWYVVSKTKKLPIYVYSGEEEDPLFGKLYAGDSLIIRRDGKLHLIWQEQPAGKGDTGYTCMLFNRAWLNDDYVRFQGTKFTDPKALKTAVDKLLLPS